MILVIHVRSPAAVVGKVMLQQLHCSLCEFSNANK